MSDSSSSESSSDSEESGQEEAESEEDVSRRPGSGVGSGRSPGLAATGKLGSSSVLSGGSATMEKSNLSVNVFSFPITNYVCPSFLGYKESVSIGYIGKLKKILN